MGRGGVVGYVPWHLGLVRGRQVLCKWAFHRATPFLVRQSSRGGGRGVDGIVPLSSVFVSPVISAHLDAGVVLFTTQPLAGHANVQTTARSGTHRVRCGEATRRAPAYRRQLIPLPTPAPPTPHPATGSRGRRRPTATPGRGRRARSTAAGIREAASRDRDVPRLPVAGAVAHPGEQAEHEGVQDPAQVDADETEAESNAEEPGDRQADDPHR